MLRNKLALFISLIILSGVSAQSIKISPTQQLLEINQYETNCTNIWVLPESNYLISSKWSNDGRGDLSKYNLTKEKIKLKINYSYLSDGKYEVCFTPNKAGHISGIIYFYDEKNMIEIGAWIDLKVKNLDTFETISLITGNVVGSANQTNIILGVIFVLLIIILSLIVRNFIRTRKNKHS